MTAIPTGQRQRPTQVPRQRALSMVERLLTTLAVLTIAISAIALAQKGAVACALLSLGLLPFINPLILGRKGERR